MRFFKSSLVGLSVVAALTVSPVTAETLEELDALAEATAEENSGIALAQQQAERGEFLEAISSLERVLALHPKSQTARLLHAVYLCQIDDQQGGALEMDELKKKHFTDELWAQAKLQCPLADED